MPSTLYIFVLIRFSVRAVSLENLVSVLDRPVPEILGFGKRTENQNEVPDWRKRAKKSFIFEKNLHNFQKFIYFQNFKKKFRKFPKISELFLKKTGVFTNFLFKKQWFPPIEHLANSDRLVGSRKISGR